MDNGNLETGITQDNSKGLSMTYGLLTGVAMVVYSLVLHFTNVSMTSWMNYVVLAIFLVGVLLFCLAYGKSKDHNVTFGNVFKAGFRMVALTTLVMLAWAVIAILVFPEMKEKSLEATQQQLVKQKMSAEKIEETMTMTRNKYTLLTVMVVMFSNLFYGVVFSLIGAAITKKNKIKQY
jgi:MFS family permease